MPRFVVRVGAIGRWYLAKRALCGLPVDFPVSFVTGGLLKGFDKFGASDRDRLAPERVSFERAIPQRFVYPSGKGLLQPLRDH